MKLQRIIAHIVMEVYGFTSFAKLLRLGYVFFKTESFESFKKRSWTRNFDHYRPRQDFFLAKFSKYRASRCWVAIFLLSREVSFNVFNKKIKLKVKRKRKKKKVKLHSHKSLSFTACVVYILKSRSLLIAEHRSW